VLHQARDIRIIFQDAYALTQMALPEVLPGTRYHPTP
jgi:hypothetical protein